MIMAGVNTCSSDLLLNIIMTSSAVRKKKTTNQQPPQKRQVDESRKSSHGLNSSRNISIIMIWLIRLFELVTSKMLASIIYYIS